MTDVRGWIGREETRADVLRAEPARFMQAVLDEAPSLQEGDALPPLWHWLYFLEAKRARDLGRDAHPKTGGFLPPMDLPRRMWAGGRFVFHAPLRLGEVAEKRSVILDVVEKTGRSGRLCFVTVQHELSQGGRLCLTEEHDIVYREDPATDAPMPAAKPAPERAAFSERIEPNAALLFRYSALTFNGHRIHYDVDYAREVEGYEGLVFHGPLTATLLARLAERQAGKRLARFAFRGLAPLAGLHPFDLQGEGARLWAKRQDGALAMEAEAAFSEEKMA